MAKKETFTQDQANAIIEAAALAAFLKFGFNPAAILCFEITPAGEIYINPELAGAKAWYYLKDPVGEEAFIYNEKTGEVLLVESEDSWSEKAQKRLSQIGKADLKLWEELTGTSLILAESEAKAKGKAKAKKTSKAKSKPKAKTAVKKAKKAAPKKAKKH